MLDQDPTRRRNLKQWLKRMVNIAEPPVRMRPFYCRYPFHSGVAIEGADARGFIDHKLRVFYNRVPKAANTSVLFSLIKLSTGREPDGTHIKRELSKPSELTAQQVEDLDSYFKFTFVRDPYTRALSAYLSKIALGKKIKPRLARINRVPTFRDFCAYLADGGLYVNAHWAPQTALMLIPLSCFHFIGRVEHFDRDIGLVLARLGAKNPAAAAVTYSSFATHSHQRMREYYDDESRAIIATLYQADFEVFGYAP